MFGLSAIECFIAIIAVFVFLYWITPKKLSWLPFLVTTVLFAVLAFNVTPNETDDLSRYFHTIEQLKENDYDFFLDRIEEDFMDWKTYRVCAYYFYFISKLSSVHYLPAITIFLVYGLGFLVIYKASVRFNVCKLYLFIGSMFFISTYWYYDTCSGIRNGLAFAIVTACAYYHLVERKNISLCIVGYILACFLHSGGIIMVSLVVLTAITLNNSGKFMNFLLIFGLSAGGALLEFLSTKTDNSFIQSIAGKAETNGAEGQLYTQTLYIVNISIFAVVAIILFYVSIYIVHGEYSKDLKRFYKFSSIISYFLVGCLLSELVFMRITRWVLPVIGAVIYMVGMQIQKNQIDDKGISYLTYFTPTNQSLRIKIRPVVHIMFTAYTLVHLWYLINGSSLCWIHF
ncbi:MAG: EpsG family protein [Eubacterium sp.]